MRKIWSALMLLVITSQIFANTLFTASEIVSYTKENETAEVSSDTDSKASEANADVKTEDSEGVAAARGLVSPTTNYNTKAEDFIVADVGNLRDGTESWNEQDGPGWDTGDKNGIVRTFDTVSYRVDFAYNNADIITKDVIIRAIAPEGDYTWQTDSLNALGYEVTDYGNGTIDVRLKNVPAGSGAQTELSLFVGEQRHGDTFKPKFEFYLNDTNEEPITVLDQVPETTVSAVSSINVVLNFMGETNPHTIELDGQKYKRQYLAYELQLMKVPENRGTMKGIELPDPTVPLEFNVDIELEKIVGNVVTKQDFYIHDVGLNQGSGFLENSFMTHNNITQGSNFTSRPYPIISKSSLKGQYERYLEDSGDLTVTQSDGQELASSYLNRNYETIRISFENFKGIKQNNERKLRVDGSVPFASGGLMVITEVDLKPDKQYTIQYTAEVDKNDDASFTDTNINDNIVVGTSTINPIGSGRSVDNYMSVIGLGLGEWLDGLSKLVIGETRPEDSRMSLEGSYIDEISSLELVNINDPRAFVVNEQKYTAGGYINNIYYALTTTLGYAKAYDAKDISTRKYGVVDFTQFGDIMDPKYYEGNPGTTVTTGGASENIDVIEQYILNLKGDEETIRWFDTTDEAKEWADSNEGWYFVGFKTILDVESQNLSSEEYSKLAFHHRTFVTLLNNEYTRYLFENYETAVWASSYWFNTKEGSSIESDVWYSTQLGSLSETDYGPFGFRKTTYDDNGILEKMQHPKRINHRANSVLPLGAKPTIKKTVTKTNGESLGSNSNIVVPGIDEAVKWNIEVGLQSTFEIIKDTPLTVTDTVPAGLELDESSIYPKTDPERGIEVKITTNSEGQKVITWIFTSELAKEEFSKLSYVTLVDPWTENNITFTETATADFLRDEYQVASEAGVLTQLRAGLTVQKLVNKTVIMPDEKELVYTLKYRNMAGPGVTEDYKLYDLFPSNTDDRETTYTGSMKLKNIEIDHQDSGVEIQYTFDEGRTNQDIVDAEFKTEAEWTALGKNIEDATGIYVWLPNVAANVIEHVKLTFDTNGNSAQDLLVNNFRMSYEFNGTTFPLLSNTVMSSVPGISKSVAKTESGPFGDSLMLNRGEDSVTIGTNEPDQFVYKIDVMVPKVKAGVTLDPFTLTDQIMPELNILNVKLVDEAGEEITDLNGDLSIDNNLVTYEFNNNLADINGTVVSMFIEVRVKATVPNFDMYPDGKLPNVANLNIVGEDLESNEVVVEINGEVDPLRPTQNPDPRDPTIAKSILNKDMEDKGENLLVNATDEFFYKVDFTVSSFTSKGLVNSFTVKDQIKPELDILEVVLLDVDGNDVTEQFKDNITTVDNLVSFNLPNIEEVHAVNRQSFSLLIKVATTPGKDFSAYPNGKLPNVAILDVNDEETETDEVTAEKIDTLIKKIVVDEDGDGIVAVGETLTYTLEVSNPTNTDAVAVAVRDSMLEDLPNYVTFNKDITVTGSKSSGDLTDGTLVLDTVVAKDKVTITYTITVNDIPKDFTGLLNVATDNGDDPIVVDPEICDEVDCDDTITVVEDATTIIKKLVADEDGNDLVAVGETLTYTIEVSNPTGNQAYDVTVRDSMLESLPEYVTFNDDVKIKGSDFSGDLVDGSLVLDKVVSKESVLITYSITVNDIPKDVTNFLNVATDNGVDPETVDPDTCDEVDCDETTTEIEPADTHIRKSVINEDGLVKNGETLVYTLEVENVSNMHAYDVVVRDSMLENLPSYLTFNDDVTIEGSTFTGNLVDGNLVLDNVVAGETVVITYSVTVKTLPNDISGLFNVATDNGVDPETVDPDTCDEIDCDETTTPINGNTIISKSIVDEDGNGKIAVGETLTYTIEVTNVTENVAYDVAVRDSMLENTPSYVTFNDDIDIDGARSSGDLTAGTLVFKEIKAGKSVVITYTITVNDLPKDVTSLLNLATDNGDDPLVTEREECDEVDCDETTTPVETPDTHIKKSVVDENGNGLAAEGEILTYTLEISNPTGNHAYDVAVRDSMLENLPTFATFNDDVTIEGSKFTGSLVDGTLVLDKVAAKGSVVVTYSITVTELPTDVTELLNVATDNGDDPTTVDPEVCDKIDCDQTETPLQGDTKISKSIHDANENGIVEVGEKLTYTIEVENYTIHNAVNVIVRDSMVENTPSWLTFGNDVTIERSDISFTGTLADANLTFYTIAPGEIVTITYTMTAGPALPDDVINVINIATDNGTDPESVDPETCEESNDCASTVDPLNANVTINKSVSDANGNGKVDGGEVLTYTIDVFNPSNDASAFNVVVRDSMLENTPEWLTYNGDATINPEGMEYTGSLTESGLTFAEIESQQGVTITYTMTADAKIPTNVPAAINIATSNGIDPLDPEACERENECAETETPVMGSTTIAKKLVDESGDGSIQNGEKLNYTITVTNVTDTDANDVVVRDSMLENTPEWLTYNKDMKLTAGIKYSGDLTSADLVIDTIKAGESVDITYSMTVSSSIPADVAQVINIATDNGQDPNEVDPNGQESSGDDSAVAIGIVDTVSQLQVTGSNMIIMLCSLIGMLIVSLFIKRRVSN